MTFEDLEQKGYENIGGMIWTKDSNFYYHTDEGKLSKPFKVATKARTALLLYFKKQKENLYKEAK